MFIEFFLIFILSLAFIKVIQKYAVTWGLVDIPNDRSAHINQTARGAGIGFYLAVVLVLTFFHLDLVLTYIWTFIAIFLVFAIGTLDDYKGTSPKVKFLVLIVATILICFDDILINNLGIFFGVDVSLGWFAIPFTVFAVVGFTNALNLIDGLDGLSATVSIVILSTFFFVGYVNNDLFLMSISAAFIISLLAFLIYNWYPASIFMGDSGSLTLGFVISILAIKSLDYLPAISIFFVTAIPLFDTLIVMIRRKRNGRSMFVADSCHLHHIFKELFKESTRKTVLFLGVLQVGYSLVGLQFNKSIDEGFLLILFIFNIVMLYLFLSSMIKKQKRKC